MQHLLLNIQKIEYTPAKNLSTAFIFPGNHILFPSEINFEEIPIIGLASCEISNQIVKNTKVYTIKLVFECCRELFDISALPFVFRLKTVGGRDYILGTAYKPYPVAHNDMVMPSAPKDKSSYNVTVTLESLYPLLSVY